MPLVEFTAEGREREEREREREREREQVLNVKSTAQVPVLVEVKPYVSQSWIVELE